MFILVFTLILEIMFIFTIAETIMTNTERSLVVHNVTGGMVIVCGVIVLAALAAHADFATDTLRFWTGMAALNAIVFVFVVIAREVSKRNEI
jgi:hypothetical protein